MIKIYNTLKRKKEEFATIEKGKVKMYVCGPTVYDVPHIGHARSAYVFEVVRRYLEFKNYEVFFVRNVTDVDDKIIARALKDLSSEPEGEVLRQKVTEIASKYLDIYHQEMDTLGIRKPSIEPKATENIGEMISFIEKLIEKGYAYPSGGDVYFEVEKFSGYGKLSGQDKNEMLHGSRINVDDKKHHPLDFALWKEAKPGEPSWESPWGEGRPGWHIECSVMSTNILGREFDIHGGGLDLIFPHHENEIAQSEALTGTPFAKYWIHNGLLTVNGEKMSKSLGNYITIESFLAKYQDPDLLKISFLTSHYRSPVDYSDDKMQEIKSSKERIMIFLEKAEKFGKLKKTNEESSIVKNLREKFENAMDDDFNTPVAFSVVFDAVHMGNEYLSGQTESKDKDKIISEIRKFIKDSGETLALSLEKIQVTSGEIKEIEELIQKREEARRDKNFAMADEVRDKLKGMGIAIEDTPEGTVWRKT